MPSAAPRQRGSFGVGGFVDGNDDCRVVEHLLVHEKVMGEDCVSHGGRAFIKELASLTVPKNPTTNIRVLNIGCGLGKFGFLVAGEHPSNLTVHVCDPNATVIQEAQARVRQKYPQLLSKVHFESADLDDLDYPPSFFDAIVCIELNSFAVGNKGDLIRSKLMNWLTPGGKLVMVDYCWSRRVQERISMVSDPSYSTSSINLGADDYRACLKACSISQLRVEDRTLLQRDLIHLDLLRLESMTCGSKREDCIKRECLSQWRNLERLLTEDSLQWFLFCATKSIAV